MELLVDLEEEVEEPDDEEEEEEDEDEEPEDEEEEADDSVPDPESDPFRAVGTGARGAFCRWCLMSSVSGPNPMTVKKLIENRVS
mmetsp:Transcript_719/g.1062  ORF Transcript_719/g.1062 Transcript_719/m.1062 type:complete len:85 (-) Transcript_719:2525-2779(-)